MNETPTPPISNLKSLLPIKYAYLSESDFAKGWLHLLFDDQSSINYINENIKGDSFFDLLLSHDLKISDFPEYHRETLQYLIDNNVLIEKNAVTELKRDNLVIFSKTLFTKQESEYLNFLLNNQVFDNSWAIRNRYQHGMPNYVDSKEYGVNNALSLLILMVYIIKIDDELKFRYQ